MNFTYYFLGPLRHFSKVQAVMVIVSACTIDEAMALVCLTLDGGLKLLEGLSLSQALGVYYRQGYVVLTSSLFLHPFCWGLCLQIGKSLFSFTCYKTYHIFISSDTAHVHAVFTLLIRCMRIVSQSTTLFKCDILPVSPVTLHMS